MGGQMRLRSFALVLAVALTAALAALAPNGKSLSTVLAGPFVVEPNGDGTVTVTINGNDCHITAPGQGTIFAAVGKLVYIADASDVFTPLTILKSTGRQDASQFPATCEGLS